MNPLETVRLWLPVAISLASPLVGFVAAQPAQSTRPAELLSPAEFPDYDVNVWREQRSGLATRRLLQQPGSPEIAGLLQQNRVDDALRVLRVIVDKYPESIARAFEIVSEQSSLFTDQARGYPESLQELVDAARKQLARLPREEAARAERRLLLLDRQPSVAKRPAFADQLRTFVKQYAGTETALLTEIDVIGFGLPIRQRLEALDRFVRDHPGSIAAAKALYQKAFQLGSVNVYPDVEPRGADPTDRFFQVLAIVKELESGRYPSCEWVDRSPGLVAFFFAHNPTYTPGSIDRQLAAYKEFAKTHFDPLSFETEHIIATKMFDLFELNGEGVAGVERVLTELEREMPDVAGVQYLRAVFYLQSRWKPSGERFTFDRKAIESLRRLQSQGTGVYHRKALAILASLYFSERDYRNARDQFRKYLGAYPDTAWAWVAALRIGQSNEALGDWRAAVDAYLTAASKYSSVPFARVLGRAYAARGYEALGQFSAALREYQAALTGWDTDYGQTYSLHITQRARPNQLSVARDHPDVSITGLPERIARLKNSLSVPGGALLERGRWLAEHGRHEEALASLEQLLTRHRLSPAVAEARYLSHRARLGSALELADAASPKRNDAAAIAQLDLITRDRYDFGVCAARIARASIIWRLGMPGADSQMTTALNEWYEHQAAQRETPRDAIEQDIADIREVVVRPAGDGILSGWARNTFLRTPASVAFAVVNPDISVKLADARNNRLSVYQSVRGADRVLFLNDEQQALLTAIVAKLGRTPEPDQPAKIDILGFWNRFFPGERQFGAISENVLWILFETYPIVTELEFLNAERTKAAARVRVGHEGGTIVLEKRQGVWTALALVNTWIA